ncbi:MAG: RNA-binding motif, single-stranded-interacting protein 1 [Paramarteilia canceri]
MDSNENESKISNFFDKMELSSENNKRNIFSTENTRNRNFVIDKSYSQANSKLKPTNTLSNYKSRPHVNNMSDPISMSKNDEKDIKKFHPFPQMNDKSYLYDTYLYTLKVKYLPSDAKESYLIRLCRNFGQIHRVIIQSTENEPDSVNQKEESESNLNNKNTGLIGHIEFYYKNDAVEATKYLENHYGFSVDFVQERKLDPTNLYLTGIPDNYNEKDLRKLLEQFGTINSVRLVWHNESIIGFARCESPSVASSIIEALNNVHLSNSNKPLRIKRANAGKRKN